MASYKPGDYSDEELEENVLLSWEYILNNTLYLLGNKIYIRFLYLIQYLGILPFFNFICNHKLCSST